MIDERGERFAEVGQSAEQSSSCFIVKFVHPCSSRTALQTADLFSGERVAYDEVSVQVEQVPVGIANRHRCTPDG